MMYIDAQPSVSPEVLQGLKKDIMSSLHVALPGIVESYDPYAGTVDVQPAVRSRLSADGEPVIYPILREVPVFAPQSACMDIHPGDMCLLVFADANIDGWYDTGQPVSPPSGRQHDLSDAFAFVGFRSRNQAAEVLPTGRMNYYGVCETSAGTRVKKVSIPEIRKLEEGVSIKVRFVNSQTYNGAPQLQLNDFEAVNIGRRSGENAARYEWVAGEVISFVYNGSIWLMENGNIATTTYYGLTKLVNSATSTSSSTAMTPSALSALAKNMLSGADIYSSTAPYAVGERCRHGYLIYRCTVPIGEGGEAWNDAHWEAEPPLIQMIDALSERIAALENV